MAGVSGGAFSPGVHRFYASPSWVVIVMAAVLAIHWDTANSMAAAWRSDTYSHGYLVLPVFLWLVWQRRAALRPLQPRPSVMGLLAMAAASLLWMAGRMGAAQSPTQIAMVAMMPAAVAAVLGTAWVRALAFPFAFLFFAVPFGESLVPTMMEWTADFTVAALRLSGVPVYREGNFFELPGGHWSVMEACSGIRYISACAMVAALHAWNIYRSNGRRLLFVAAALAMALVVNWVRAYVIVMIAHHTDNRLAVGVDHFLYGYVMFGVLLALMIGLGKVWRERPAPAHASPARSQDDLPAESRGRPMGRRAAVAIAALAVVGLAPAALVRGGDDVLQAAVPPPVMEARGGWVETDEPVAKWQPTLANPSWKRVQTFMKDGRRVSVFIGGFGRPTPDSKLIASVNRLAPSDGSPWKPVRRGTTTAQAGGHAWRVNTGSLLHESGFRLAAWQWYWLDGTATISDAEAAWLQMLSRLRGRYETSAWIAAFTEELEDGGESQRVLEAFLSDMSGSIHGAVSHPRR